MLYHFLHSCQLNLFSTPSRCPGLLQRLPSQGCHLALGSSGHSTWQLVLPAAQPTSPFPVSHKWELPSLLTTLVCLCQKCPAFLHKGIVISVIFTCFEMGWISCLPPVTYRTRSPTEEAARLLGLQIQPLGSWSYSGKPPSFEPEGPSAQPLFLLRSWVSWSMGFAPVLLLCDAHLDWVSLLQVF